MRKLLLQRSQELKLTVLKNKNHGFLIALCPDKSLKGTVNNRGFHSCNGGWHLESYMYTVQSLYCFKNGRNVNN